MVRMKYSVNIVIQLLGIFAILFGLPVYAAEVCRSASFEDMYEETQRIKHVVGTETTDVSKIVMYVSLTAEGDFYIQSNFKSADPESGETSEYPTKLKSKNIKDVEQALLNIIFWSKLPANASSIVAKATKTVQVLVDPRLLDASGRPKGFDLSGIENIRMATSHGVMPTGQIDVLTLNKPPPALVERIAGCCFRGRPPGKGKLIQSNLAKQRIDPANTHVLSMVIDRTTSRAIEESSQVDRIALGKGASAKSNWEAILDQALDISAGKTLIVVGHIVSGRVTVEAPNRKALFSIPIEQLHAKAKSKGVGLLLLGCDTAASAADAGIPVAVQGRYRTDDAIRRVDDALKTAHDAATFLAAISSERLILVAQPGNWGPDAVGGAIYKPAGLKRMYRVMRFWFMGGGRG